MKRKLLFLAQTFPFPPTGGVTLRTFNVIKQLSREYEIQLLAFDRKRSPPATTVPSRDIETMSEFAVPEVIKIPQHLSRTRLLSDHLRSLLFRRVFTVYRLDSVDFMRALDRRLDEWSPDLIHLDSLDLSSTLPRLPHDRTVVTHHNVESELLERRADVESNAVRAVYFRIQGKFQQREERLWCPKVALNVTVSDRDGEELTRRAGGGRYISAPNGVDTKFFSPGDTPVEDQQGVVCVGGTTWFPNRDALEYFATVMQPILQSRASGTRVEWVGRARPSEISEYAELGIEMTGFVDDIRDHVRRAACFVMPFRVGGGTRLKLLDAWAMGKAVVSTSQGAEGVEAIDGENILIRDDPEEFVSAIVDVLNNQDLRDRLGRGARRTAEQVYSWEKIGTTLRGAYADL